MRLFMSMTFFKILPPPWCTVGRERHKLKNKERQRGDRDTNWRLDKSQREEMILCSPWLCELEFFYLEWGPLSQALTGRVSCHVCKHGGWEIGRLASWQKDPVVWLWQQQQQPMAAQTPTSGSCLLGAHSDRPDSAKGNLSPLISTPMACSNCHPSLFSQRWRMNHKLLQRNDIFSSERNPP